MTKTRVIGDIHGLFQEYQNVVEDGMNNGITHSVQVGDFGIGFSGPYWHDKVNHFHSDSQHRFIRGNHDNPEKCKEMNGWIPDGTVENDTMYIGGAWSIDQMRRVEGVNWWRDEELSIAEFEDMIQTYEKAKPRVMITHDAPNEAIYEMFFSPGQIFFGYEQYRTRTADALQAMFEIHQPEFHFFGHWHRSMAYKHGNTTFVCFGECDTIDVDLTDSDQMHKAIYEKFKI